MSENGNVLLPDRDYSCGAQFCDDPACNTHGLKNADDELLYWKGREIIRVPKPKRIETPDFT